MWTTCERCGARVRVAKRAGTRGVLRLDSEPMTSGRYALVHGAAVVHDPVAAQRIQAFGVPLYAPHECSNVKAVSP